MPGPHESSLSVDSYLSSLIQELSQFWQGVLIPFQHNGVTTFDWLCLVLPVIYLEVEKFVGLLDIMLVTDVINVSSNSK